jgi:hypothetical protein
MSAEEPATWETYEEVANYLLERMSDTLELGLERVEGEQKLVGKGDGLDARRALNRGWGDHLHRVSPIHHTQDQLGRPGWVHVQDR